MELTDRGGPGKSAEIKCQEKEIIYVALFCCNLYVHMFSSLQGEFLPFNTQLSLWPSLGTPQESDNPRGYLHTDIFFSGLSPLCNT